MHAVLEKFDMQGMKKVAEEKFGTFSSCGIPSGALGVHGPPRLQDFHGGEH